MKREIELPREIDWVSEQLMQMLQRAEGEVRSGGRPEYAAGMFDATVQIIDDLERQFAELLRARSNLRGMKVENA